MIVCEHDIWIPHANLLETEKGKRPFGYTHYTAQMQIMQVLCIGILFLT